MLLLVSICSYPWWLWWLLPFLLGLLLGWLLWGRLSGRIAELEADNTKLKSKIKGLNDDLSSCLTDKAGLGSEISLLEGQLREERSKDRSTLGAAASGGTHGGIQKLHGDTAEEVSEKKEMDIVKEVESDPNEMEMTDASEDSDIAEAVDTTPSDYNEVIDTEVNAKADTTDIEDGGQVLSSVPAAGGTRRNIYAGLKEDNLQVVEGIGPKMNEVLNNAGVATWKDLSSKSVTELRAVLNAANAKRYRIIDPSSWAEQAGLAASGDWEALINLQKNLDTGRAQGATGETDSKVEKLLIKMGAIKRWKQDDLTAVEGIGPKISGLLQEGGITTWRALAYTEVSKIQGILDAAGKRYKLADPSTWPKQAEMAADGRWDDLDEYQNFLRAGK